jgi:hypothetical protein
MRKKYTISPEEASAMDALGGFDKVVEAASRILREHGIERDLFSSEERESIRHGGAFVKRQIEFCFDASKSLRANIEDLLSQAAEIQETRGGTHYVGTMLQHLVGAKLDIVLGQGRIHHHGFSVADQSTDRKADYQIDAVAIYVTTHPTEALVRKCGENIKAGLKPLIITLGDAVSHAEFNLKTSELNDRVDVLDATQFLTANVYERSLFQAAECMVTLAALLSRYNAIVEECETDPSLRIKLPC